MLKKVWWYIKPFRDVAHWGRETDGRTDGRTDAHNCYSNIARQRCCVDAQ